MRRDAPRMLCDVIMKAMAREPAATVLVGHRTAQRPPERASHAPQRWGPHAGGAPTDARRRGGHDQRQRAPPRPVPRFRPRASAATGTRHGAPHAGVLQVGAGDPRRALIVLAIIVAAILISRTDSPGSVTDRRSATVPPQRSATTWRRLGREPPAVASFDPAGDNKEGEATKGNATDGNPGTRWTTEYYRDQQLQTVPNRAWASSCAPTRRPSCPGSR